MDPIHKKKYSLQKIYTSQLKPITHCNISLLTLKNKNINLIQCIIYLPKEFSYESVKKASVQNLNVGPTLTYAHLKCRVSDLKLFILIRGRSSITRLGDHNTIFSHRTNAHMGLQCFSHVDSFLRENLIYF